MSKLSFRKLYEGKTTRDERVYEILGRIIRVIVERHTSDESTHENIIIYSDHDDKIINDKKELSALYLLAFIDDDCRKILEKIKTKISESLMK